MYFDPLQVFTSITRDNKYINIFIIYLTREKTNFIYG